MTLKKNIKLSTYSCNLNISVVDSVAESVDKLYKKYKINGSFGSEAREQWPLWTYRIIICCFLKIF